MSLYGLLGDRCGIQVQPRVRMLGKGFRERHCPIGQYFSIPSPVATVCPDVVMAGTIDCHFDTILTDARMVLLLPNGRWQQPRTNRFNMQVLLIKSLISKTNRSYNVPPLKTLVLPFPYTLWETSLFRHLWVALPHLL